MTTPVRTTLPLTALQKHRGKRSARGMKRHEIWVPADFTRREAEVLRQWMPEIIADLRQQLKEQSKSNG